MYMIFVPQRKYTCEAPRPVTDIALLSVLLNRLFYMLMFACTHILASSDFPAADPEVPGSIPGSARFSE
jgi:hypothetical protein